MWNTNNLVSSMKHGLRFENNNYLVSGSERGKRFAKPDILKEQTTPPHYHRQWMYYLVPGLAAVVCFLNSLQGEFVHDDIPAIVNNPDVTGGSSWREIFSHDFWGKSMLDNTSHKSYRPITVLTFRVNYMLGGLSPVGYHVVNVLLHALATVLFTRVCHRFVLRDLHYSSLAGTLFATHPIHTEAVSGVVGRADVLCCVFFLLSFYAHQRCLSTTPSGVLQTRRPGFLVASLGLAVCATLCKEQGITVLGVCVCSDLISLHTTRTNRVPGSKHTLAVWPVLRRCALFTSGAAVCLFARLWVQGGELPQFTDQDNPASFHPHRLVRFLTYSYLPVHNLWLLLVPVNLSYDWQMGSVPLVTGWGDWRIALTLLVAALLGCLVAKVLSEKGMLQRSLAIGLLFLVVPFLPALNLFFRVGFVIAERILYIPSMGYIVILISSAKSLASRDGAWRRNINFILVLVCLLFSGKSISRNNVWRSRENLFKSGLISVPHNAKMHYNYANYLKDQNQIAEAETYYRNAIRLWPGYASAHNNLGTVLPEPAEAVWHYREALRLVPCHANAHFNLGSLLWRLSQPREAISSLEEAVSCDRNSVSPFYTLASIYRSLEQNSAAEESYRRAISRAPRDPRASYNLADFLYTQGRHEEALHHVRKSLHYDADNPISLRLAGLLLAKFEKNPEAFKTFTRSLAIDRDPTTLDVTGVFLLNISETKQAIEYFKEACRLAPNVFTYKIHLAQALSKAGLHMMARDVLEEVVKSASPAAETLIILANVYGNLNEHHKATSVLEEALTLTKNNVTIADIHLSLGKHYRDMKNMDVSFYHYQLAASLNEGLGEAHHNLGVFYHMQGELDKARHHYTRALSLHPGNTVLKQNFAKLLKITQQDETKTSAEQSEEIIEEHEMEEKIPPRVADEMGTVEYDCAKRPRHQSGDTAPGNGLHADVCFMDYRRNKSDAFNESHGLHTMEQSVTNHLAESSNYADSLSIG